jgi:hypothetical protein
MGKVLVTGGSPETATAELYDPVTGKFALTGSMAVARSFHTATLLANGKVLVVGGATAELYDPSTQSFAAGGTLIIARRMHTATLLDDDRVLIIGGAAGTGFSATTSTAEIYDPTTGSFARTGGMKFGRLWHTATDFHDGNVLVVGGPAQATVFTLLL